jgi:tetratricopeptide (TPR) repeat protein
MESTPAEIPVAERLRRAVAFHQKGLLRQAETAYLDILRSDPRHFDALHLLGVIAAQTNDPARAVELIQKSVEIDPNQAPPHANLGGALMELGRHDAAITSLDRAIALDPGYADAHFNRGNAMRALERWDAALASYDRCLAIRPGFAAAHFYRGNTLCELARLEDALSSYDAAIAANPAFAEALLNRGNVLRQLGRIETAIDSYDRATALNARYAEAHFNRGVALGQLKRVDEALQSYDRAIAMRAEYAEARFNKSLLLLLKGDFAGGWREHEWRWWNRYGSNYRDRRTFSQPQWLGTESIAGKTVLLHAEQGFGDTLQFCRYAKLVCARGAKVILEAPEQLLGLLASLGGVSQLLRRGSALPDFDYHCPLMSLPLAFGTTVDSIPSEPAYLSADPSKVAAWQLKLGEKRRPRIGLTWNGNAIQPNDRNRSCRLADWTAHLPSQFQFVSLQREVRDADRRTLDANPAIWDFAAELADFSDTAALCECMDLVLSVCTSAAHLGGALGKPTWVMLSFAADWRWLLDRTDSPWYPSVKLYRQPSRGDWRSVFERVAADLRSSRPLQGSRA